MIKYLNEEWNNTIKPLAKDIYDSMLDYPFVLLIIALLFIGSAFSLLINFIL
jgi:uncharacterized RDD family membrane protein YckC